MFVFNSKSTSKKKAIEVRKSFRLTLEAGFHSCMLFFLQFSGSRVRLRRSGGGSKEKERSLFSFKSACFTVSWVGRSKRFDGPQWKMVFLTLKICSRVPKLKISQKNTPHLLQVLTWENFENEISNKNLEAK